MLSGYYYEKTELGTKVARSQLCINIVLLDYSFQQIYTLLGIIGDCRVVITPYRV